MSEETLQDIEVNVAWGKLLAHDSEALLDEVFRLRTCVVQLKHQIETNITILHAAVREISDTEGVLKCALGYPFDSGEPGTRSLLVVADEVADEIGRLRGRIARKLRGDKS